MTSDKITAGLLIPSLESREYVRTLTEATGSISVVVESEDYCANPGDSSARQLINARPEIILIDMENPEAGLSTIETLHAALPETRLYAISEKTGPKLIIEAVRAGAREFFLKPVQPSSLAQAMERYLAEKQRMLETRREGSVYCFTAGKEGSGATTMAINVASVLSAVPGTRVVLIDLDSPGGDTAMYLKLAPQHKIEDALSAGSRLDSLLLDSCVIPAYGFSVLLPPRKEFGAPRTPGSEPLARLLKVAAQTYSHVVVDLPRTLPKDYLQVVTKAAEALVVVLNPELSSIARTGHLLRHLSDCEVNGKIQLVINRSRKSDEIAVGWVEKALHHPIYFRVPDDSKESAKAIMAGKPLVKGSNSSLACSYDELAHKLACIPGPKGRHRLKGAGSGRSRWRAALSVIFPFLGKPAESKRSAAERRRKAGLSESLLRANLRD